MSALFTCLFLAVAVFALRTIWTEARRSLPSISRLRSDLLQAEDFQEVRVTLRDTQVPALRHRITWRAKQRRHHEPKPVTHRLHHFRGWTKAA